MGAFYMTHPRHGALVVSNEMEVKYAKENGWSECSDPRDLLEKQEASPEAPVTPVVVPTAPVVPLGLPPGLQAPSGAPAGLPGVPSDLPENFPGRLSLIEAGYTTWASIVGKTAEQLDDIKGIGPATAAEILKVMNS